ncbi:GNAT family N-acetyltransferase [Clostridium chromiireducens]|uniref:GNAT family N-acetyltransferase n=1 Tax=Clostridium chromiireducens TaxID=225345 RepID=A0A964RKD5_9CLOT|nr:GNAT family N-acetyltransferase [Clostridium chromiireducens]MVX63200.1 GNAT family N-acetyltransferase [Clostridium chromiireducens]
MVFLEKLSLFNINHLRKLYNRNEDAYICDKSFFDIYDKESFFLKYVIRKQIKLFKVNNDYIGYIWYEYPSDEGYSNIYSIYLKEEYIDLLNSKLLSFFNIKTFRFDMVASSKASSIMKKLNFNINSKNILMKMRTSIFYRNNFDKKYFFKHFKEGQDEGLRCKIQNSVFNEKNRIPLTVDDVYREEEEDYYLRNYGVFICNEYRQAVGYGQVIFNKGLYTIVNLGILKEYRHQGYGDALVKYLVGFCFKNSIKNIYIRVEKNNYQALNLYKKIGFEEYQSFITWSKNIN